MKKGVDYTGITCGCICHDGEGHVLMSKRSINCRDEQGAWEFGGGSMEFGETLEEHVAREVKEEYCADVTDLQMIGVKANLREHEGVKTHWVLFVWTAKVDPSQVKIGDPHAIDALDWFTLDNLPTPLHSTVPFELEKLKEGKIF
jgi:8-oxo-dGTP diphosphatase